MSKAACPSSKLTRRAAIAAALAGAAVPASAAALPASDPVLAMIAAHKAAVRRHELACRLLSDLEEQIPEERRQEWYAGDRAKGVGANDDPRWTAANTVYWAAFAAEEKAAWALAHARPAALAGAAALLRYAHDHEAQRQEWPSKPPDDAVSEEIWHAAFHRSLAAALEAMSS